MAYTKTNWENEPSTATPINAASLNNIENGVAEAHDQLDGPIAARASAATKRQAPSPLGDISTSNPAFTDIVGMLPDGRRKVFTGPTPNAAQIGVSEDGETFTWGENFGSANVVTGVIPTPGGEVLVAVKALDNSAPGTVHRSTGWDPSNADATSWATVLTASKNGAHMDGRWCLTERSVAPLNSPGAGAMFLCEYDGNRAWMSVDDGVTWAQIFDLQTAHPGANRIHAIAYDRWDDRVWVTVGDASFAGIYYADRAKISGTGTPWTLLPGSASEAWQVTTVVPLSNAVVFLSDTSDSGVFAVLRDGVGGYKSLRNVVDLPDFGLIGAHAYQAADDLPAFLTFNQSGSGQTPLIIATIDGEHFSTVYTDTEVVSGSAPGIHSIVGPDLDGNVWAVRNLAGSGALLKVSPGGGGPDVGDVLQVGGEEPTGKPNLVWLDIKTGTMYRYDGLMSQWIPYGVGSPAQGGQYNAVSFGVDVTNESSHSVAVGVEAAASQYAAVAVGVQATADEYGTVAIGTDVEALGSYSIAIGGSARAATWQGGVAIGRNSRAGNDDNNSSNCVAIGPWARTEQWDSVAVGNYSIGAGQSSVAIGTYAEAGDHSVALGESANAGAESGAVVAESTVAIGPNTAATGDYSTAIGPNASARPSSGIAIGTSSSVYAEADEGIAIGYATSVSYPRSIALGVAASPTAANQTYIATDELVLRPSSGLLGSPETPGASSSVVLYSPNGSLWRITVDDTGTLGATAVV